MMVISNAYVREYLHQFLDHFSNLTLDDRYNRFFNTMSPCAIRDWMLKTSEHPYSHYFFVEENAEGQFIGLATLAIDAESNECSLAVSILPDYRGQGLAKKLLQSAIQTAKIMKLKRANFEALSENYDCKHLMGSLGFNYKYDCEQQCTVGHLDLVN